MKIGGFQPVTLLDYPDKVAAIIFTGGCNMRCPFCYNPGLVLPKHLSQKDLYDEKDILVFLKERKKYLDAVVITGGEPTLQTDLSDFLFLLKKLDYLIKIDTNGLLPGVLDDLFNKKLIDYIAMDIKGDLNNMKPFSGISDDKNAISKSIDKIMSSGLPYEFRSTLVKGLHNEDTVKKMSQAIKKADKYYLQSFKEGVDTVGDASSFKSFTNKEMKRMKHIAEKYVKICEIR